MAWKVHAMDGHGVVHVLKDPYLRVLVRECRKMHWTILETEGKPELLPDAPVYVLRPRVITLPDGSTIHDRRSPA